MSSPEKIFLTVVLMMYKVSDEYLFYSLNKIFRM